MKLGNGEWLHEIKISERCAMSPTKKKKKNTDHNSILLVTENSSQKDYSVMVTMTHVQNEHLS